MFKSKKQAPNPNTTDTLIGEGTSLQGCIRSEASIRIEGRITGDIRCAGDVIIGERGSLKSDITARDVIVAGSVHGNIATSGKLIITSTGSLVGNINTSSITIEEGGVFQGTSVMEKKLPSPAPQSGIDTNPESLPAPAGENESMDGATVAI